MFQQVRGLSSELAPYRAQAGRPGVSEGPSQYPQVSGLRKGNRGLLRALQAQWRVSRLGVFRIPVSRGHGRGSNQRFRCLVIADFWDGEAESG